MKILRTPVRILPVLLAAVLALMLATTLVSAQATATALIREDDKLPGTAGLTISSISNPAVNRVGGYAATVNVDDAGATISHIWGSASGGPGAPIVVEGTYGSLQQTSFEAFHGFSDAGEPAYSALSNNLDSGATSLDGMWVGTTNVLNEEDPVPTIPGQFSVFNSRPGITADGQPYWVGGVGDVQGGSTDLRVLFLGYGLTPVLMGGDSVIGVPEPIETQSSSLDFDFRFSALGTNYITQVIVDATSSNDGVMVINGAAVSSGGELLREATPIPAAIGGAAGEVWDNFDFMGINEAGDYFVTGDTGGPTSSDEFIVFNGEIVLREGEVLSTDDGDFTLSGAIEGGFMNEDTDIAVIWDANDPGGANVEILLLNGEIMLKEGDAVDLDGDGEVEPTSILANFTGISSLVLSDRDDMGEAAIYFTADIDVNGTSSSSDDIEGLFRIGTEGVGITVPLDIKPGSCPNPHNASSNGVLPMSLLGTGEFDVASVDLATVQISRADGVGSAVSLLDGPPGPSPAFEDKGTPVMEDAESCDCHGELADGIMDLSLFFSSTAMEDGLDLSGAESGSAVELVVGGLLLDGTPFQARDCVVIVPPASSGGMNAAGASDGGLTDLGMSPSATREQTRSAIPVEGPRLRERGSRERRKLD